MHDGSVLSFFFPQRKTLRHSRGGSANDAGRKGFRDVFLNSLSLREEEAIEMIGWQWSAGEQFNSTAVRTVQRE